MKTKSSIQAECLVKILPLHRAGVVLTMRTGKTLLGLTHMSKSLLIRAPKFLVVAPKKAIFKSWRDDAKKFGLEFLLEYITFTTYLSLHKQDLDYDGVYLDEMHSLIKESHEPWLDSYKGKILGLTGTQPDNELSEKAQLIQKFCPVVYEYLIDEAVEDGILNDYQIIVHMLSLNPARTFQKKKKDGTFWMTSELGDYEYWTSRIGKSTTGAQEKRARITRMSAMMRYPTKENYARKLFQSISEKCILFCNTIDQAHKMSAHSYTSKNPKSEKNLEMFKTGEIDKLSAVQQLSEGITIPDLSEAIIMHSFSGSSAKTKQRFGRTQGLDPDKISTVHILCFKDSADVNWVKSALADLDQTKITWQEAGIKQLI